jgi:hypothetical protein
MTDADKRGRLTLIALARLPIRVEAPQPATEADAR